MNEDCLLVEAIRSGQTQRFEELVEKYKDRVYSMAFRFTGNPQEGQDLAQEIFINIFRNIGSFEAQSALSTWIYRVSLNRCLDWQRKQQRRASHLTFMSGRREEDQNILDRVSTGTDGPEETYLHQEQSKELQGAIANLPEKYKTVIILYHFQQLSYQEIGSILKIPVRTVETHLYRAKQKLKQILTSKPGKGVKDFEVIRS